MALLGTLVFLIPFGLYMALVARVDLAELRTVLLYASPFLALGVLLVALAWNYAMNSIRERLVIPSLLARGGATSVHFQDWLARARDVTPPPAHDASRLLRAWDETQSAVRLFKTPVKQGAMLVALGRLASALRLD